jgi:hypothetical protein
MPVRAVVKNPYDANSADFTIRKKSVTVQQKVGNNYPFSGGSLSHSCPFLPPLRKNTIVSAFVRPFSVLANITSTSVPKRSSVTFFITLKTLHL